MTTTVVQSSNQQTQRVVLEGVSWQTSQALLKD